MLRLRYSHLKDAGIGSMKTQTTHEDRHRTFEGSCFAAAKKLTTCLILHAQRRLNRFIDGLNLDPVPIRSLAGYPKKQQRGTISGAASILSIEDLEIT